MKECNKCSTIKGLEYFHKDGQSKDGYRNQCKECRKPVLREYTKKIKLKKKVYDKLNSEHFNELRRKRRSENPEKYRIVQRIYYSNNTQKVLNHNRKRRANKISSSDGTITEFNLSNLLVFQHYKCGICNNDLDEKMHLDHIHPLSKGGKDSIYNVQWTHPLCNLMKGDRINQEASSVASNPNV